MSDKKFTNRYGFSTKIEEFIAKNNEHWPKKDHRVSVTTLTDTTKSAVLKGKHGDEIVTDISEYFARIFGSGVHRLYEDSHVSGLLQECSIQRDVDVVTGPGTTEKWTISGRFDELVYNDGKSDRIRLGEFKTSSVWKYVKQEFVDYIRQLSIYRWMLTDCILTVPMMEWNLKNEEIQRNPIFKFFELLSSHEIMGVKFHVQIPAESTADLSLFFQDWSKKDARSKEGYPRFQLVESKLTLLDTEHARDWAMAKLQFYVEGLSKADDETEECSKDDRYQDPDIWAIYKVQKNGNTNQRATALRDSLKAAGEYIGVADPALDTKIKTDSGDWLIQLRPSTPKKCISYCSVRHYCHFGRDLKEEGEEDEKED